MPKDREESAPVAVPLHRPQNLLWRERKYRWLYGGMRGQLEDELGIPVESLHVEPPVAHSNVENPDHLRTLFEDHASRLGWKIA